MPKKREVVNTKVTIPAMFRHIETFYNEMVRRAKPMTDEESGMEIMVYEGRIMEMFLEVLGTGQRSNYSPIMKALKDMGCIERIRRGYAAAPSRYVLYEAPTIDKFDQVVNTPARLRERVSYGTLVEQVLGLEIKCQALEDRVNELESMILRLGGRQLHDEEESTNGGNTDAPEADGAGRDW